MQEQQALGANDRTMYIPSYDNLTGWQLVEMIIADYEAGRTAANE